MKKKKEIKTIVQRTFNTLKAGNVKRWHNLPYVKSQYNSDHSYRVAILILGLCDNFNDKIDVNKMIRYALLHDACELYTGDIPHFIKLKNDTLKNEIESEEKEAFNEKLINLPDLSKEEYCIFKVMDNLDAYMWLKLNNVGINKATFDKCKQSLDKYLDKVNSIKLIGGEITRRIKCIITYSK